MAHVDDQARAREGLLDGRPRRVGGVDLGHVRACTCGRRRPRRVPRGGSAPWCRRRVRRRSRPWGRRGGGGHGRHEQSRRQKASDEQRRDDRTEPSHDRRALHFRGGIQGNPCSVTETIHPRPYLRSSTRPSPVPSAPQTIRSPLPDRCRRRPGTFKLTRCRTASPARRVPTCSSTPTTRWTGFPGGRTRWRAPCCSIARSSSRSATRPATGATSWSASRSRTRRRRATSTTTSSRSRWTARSAPTSTRSTWARSRR